MAILPSSFLPIELIFAEVTVLKRERRVSRPNVFKIIAIRRERNKCNFINSYKQSDRSSVFSVK